MRRWHDGWLQRRELPRLRTSLGRAPTREELAELGFDAALLKRLEADGVVNSKLIVIDGSGARRRAYSLPAPFNR